MTLKVIDLIGVIVAGLAAVLAVLALRFASRHARALDDTVEKLETQERHVAGQTEILDHITQSISTRYVGPFPYFMDDVVRVVEQATRSLDILVVSPAPAIATDPESFRVYSEAIQRKCWSLSVDIICMSAARRRQRAELGIPRHGWNDWKQIHVGELHDFLELRHSEGAELPSHEDFIELLIRAQDEEIELYEKLQQSGGKIQVRQVDELVPAEIWIADQRWALFSIQTASSRVVGHGLYTEDQKLIEALGSMMDLYR